MCINGRTKHGIFHLRRLQNITEDALTHHACGRDKPVGVIVTVLPAHDAMHIQSSCRSHSACRTLWRGGVAFADNHPSKPSPFIRHNVLHPLRGFVRCFSSTKGRTPMQLPAPLSEAAASASATTSGALSCVPSFRCHRHQLELLLAVSLIHNSSIERSRTFPDPVLASLLPHCCRRQLSPPPSFRSVPSSVSPRS